MFAIVTIAGQQFKVSSGQEIFVHRLAGNPGDKVSFEEVLMTGSDNNFTLGAGVTAKVEAEIPCSLFCTLYRRRDSIG